MSVFRKYIDNPRLLYCLATAKGLTRWISDELHLKMMYKALFGVAPDLDNPRSFNEKMQWLKLHNHVESYSKVVDKLAVKDWVSERVGRGYVNDTYAVWQDVDDIDPSVLPKHYVLKTNHDCGGVIICNNPDSFDIALAKEKLRRHLNANYYWGSREWPYKNVKPLVFAEEYLERIEWEYQTWNSYGDVKAIGVITEPHGCNKKRFYDAEWRECPFVSSLPKLEEPVEAPVELMQIIELSRNLSQDFPLVRIDFIKTRDGLLRLCEMTLFPAGGFVKWQPPEWDMQAGSWIDLSRCDYSGVL